MDEKLRELARQAAESPKDAATASALARAVARSLEGVPLEERLALARTLPPLPRIVAPWGERHALVAVGGESAVLLAELPFAATSRPVFEDDVVAGIVVPFNLGPQISLRSFGERASVPFAFTVPPGFTPLAVARVGSTLYVAGASDLIDPCFLLVRDLADPGDRWLRTEFGPFAPYVMRFEALHVQGSRLIARSERAPGHVLWVFERHERLTPTIEATPTLHGVEGPVAAATFGAGWFLAVANGETRKGPVRTLALADAQQLFLRCSVSDEAAAPWRDVVVLGARAFLAAGSDGITAVDLEPFARYRQGRVDWHDRATKLRARDATSAVPLKLAAGEHVVRLATIPGRKDALVAAIGAESGSPVTRLAVISVS